MSDEMNTNKLGLRIICPNCGSSELTRDTNLTVYGYPYERDTVEIGYACVSCQLLFLVSYTLKEESICKR